MQGFEFDDEELFDFDFWLCGAALKLCGIGGFSILLRSVYGGLEEGLKQFCFHGGCCDSTEE